MKDAKRPILLIHGTADDNVYFLHSMKFCDALFRAGKPYDFLPLAGYTHMVPDPVMTERLNGRIAEFFKEQLQMNKGVVDRKPPVPDRDCRQREADYNIYMTSGMDYAVSLLCLDARDHRSFGGT